MKTTPLLLACAVLTSAASAQVYIGDVYFSPNPVGAGMATSLSSLSAGGQGACGFSFESINSGGLSTRVGAINIAEMYSLFVVTEGTTFDAAYVSSHSPVTGNSGTGPYVIPYSGQSTVLFAYWDDRALFGGSGAWGEVDSSDLFGWMRVEFSSSGGLQPAVTWTILDSATARGGGIIAGTYTQIPEPASAAAVMSVTGFVIAAGSRRRRDAVRT